MESNGDPQRLAAEWFAERARQALDLFDKRGLPTPSQGWLARRASALAGENISQPTVGKWLAGKAVPDTALRAWAFATALGVDAGWLVFDNLTTAAPPPGLAAETPTPARPEGAAQAHREVKEIPKSVFVPIPHPKAPKKRKRSAG